MNGRAIGRVGLALCVVLVVSACGQRREVQRFDGQVFRASISQGEERRDFVVQVGPETGSYLGAVEAARFEANRFCIERFGRSDHRWEVGPGTPDTAIPRRAEARVFSGQCRP